MLVKKKKKNPYLVLSSSYLLSTTEQEQRRERLGIGKERIWQRPIDFHFLLHQITAKKKKNVFHKWCSWGVDCQKVFAEKLLSQKTLFWQGSHF